MDPRWDLPIRVAYNWGITDHKVAVDAIKKFWKYQIQFKDPFFTKHQMTDAEIEAFVDRRFFAGGEYFVDVGEKPRFASLDEPAPPVAGRAQGPEPRATR